MVGGTQRRHHLHNVSPATVGRHRQAAADDLAQARQIGRDAVELLGAAVGNPEPGDDLVEDQQRAVGVGHPPQRWEKLRRWRNDTHVGRDRLDDDGRHFVPVGLQQRLDRLHVVVAGHQRQVSVSRWHARAVGHAEGEAAGPGPDQEAVGMAVVAALELDDLVTARERASDSNGAHAGLGAGAHEAEHLDGRDGVDDQSRQTAFQLGGSAEARPPLGGALDRRYDPRVRVAQDQRPPRTDVVDVLASVGIVDARALAALDERRHAAHGSKGPHGAVHAAGQQRLGLLEKRLGAARHPGPRTGPSPSRSLANGPRRCRLGPRIRRPATRASRSRPDSCRSSVLGST